MSWLTEHVVVLVVLSAIFGTLSVMCGLLAGVAGHQEAVAANQAAALANERVAVANEKAAEATLAAEHLRLDLDREPAERVPRTISASQHDLIVELLKPDRIFKGKILITTAMDGESLRFSEQTKRTLKDAGFDPQDVSFEERAVTYNMPGLFFWIKGKNKQPKRAGPIYVAFERAGIPITAEHDT
jgi:hypothetical protein